MTTQTLAEIIGSDYIDSRDLIEAAADIDTEDEDDVRLAAIVAELADSGITDWEYGAQFIRDDSFTEYAQQLAEDIGAMPEGNNWPAYCIDWEYAARELRMDYSAVEIDGIDYWVRS